MKKELIITVMCMFPVLFFSCKGNTQKSDTNPQDIKTITLSSMKETFQDTSYFKDPHIVALETTDKSLIANINRVYMDDNKLFIYDPQIHNIFIFDITGKYISKIDCKGQGSKEYIETTDFTIDTIKKQIILLCSIPEKRMYFTYEGTIIKEEDHEDFYSKLATDGNYIYFENPVLGSPKDQIHILNIKTGEKQERLKLLDIKNFFSVMGNSFNKGKDILFVRRYDNSIYKLENGEIIKKYQLDFKEHSFPERLITEKEEMVIMDECRTHEYIFAMSNVTDNDNYTMFYTNRGICLYDKKNDILTNYKQMQSPLIKSLVDDPFSFYLPLENTNNFVCFLYDPSSFKLIVSKITEQPDKIEVKKLRNEHPKLVEEIINAGNKIVKDSNPVLFIYEFKD